MQIASDLKLFNHSLFFVLATLCRKAYPILLLCAVVIIPSAAAIAEKNAAPFNDAQIGQAKRLIALAQQDDTAYELVKSLTTEVGPRLAGTQAEGRARAWAIKNLKRLGFTNVREQKFEIPVWERIEEHANIVAPFPQAITITALGGSVSTPKHGVQGEIVRVESLAELKKLPDGVLKNKIAFVDEVMVRAEDGSGYRQAVKKRGASAFEAHRLGAVAVLIRSVGTSHHRFAHTGIMRRIKDVKDAQSVPAAALSAPDADQLQRIIALGHRPIVRLKIRSKLQEKGRSANIIADIRGREKPEEIVMIGAHLDSWDLGTGAVDDGAGIGIVVAAATLIKNALKNAPRRTLRVVLFGAEEVGLYGAKHYTESVNDALYLHVAAAESDFGAGKVLKLNSANVADDKWHVVQALQEIVTPLRVIAGNNQGYGGPDTYYLKQAGVPIIEPKQNGIDYFDLHHTANDTFDKVDAAKLRQNVAVYAGVFYLLVDSGVWLR